MFHDVKKGPPMFQFEPIASGPVLSYYLRSILLPLSPASLELLGRVSPSCDDHVGLLLAQALHS